MTKQLTDGSPEEIQIDIVKAVQILGMLTEGTGEFSTANEIAEQTGASVQDVLAILGHPEFVRRFTKLRRDAAKTEFNAIAHNVLRDITIRNRTVDGGLSVKALKLWGSILGEEHSKKGANVSVSVSFEQIIKQAEAKGIPLDEKTTLYPGLD